MFCHFNLFISYVLNIIIIHQIPKIARTEYFKKCKFNLMGRLQHLVSLLHPPACIWQIFLVEQADRLHLKSGKQTEAYS